jgi:hypothetical protein
MEQKTFYTLISEHVIEVPIIQREYAQGRTNERVTAIRKRFVKDLIKSINSNEAMHLGFIYGKIEGKDKQRRKQINRDAVNSILQAVKAYADTLELKIDPNIKESKDEVNHNTQLKFIPLDGQQRLTTLYLLHWYLYLRGAVASEIYWIYNFNYTNRKSTMDFLKVINDSANFKVIQQRTSENLSIKGVIKESSFYLQKWNKDKTVIGILEMLQAVEDELNDYESFNFAEITLDGLQFQFDFMDLDALNQTNELYVKMNSRGKQLTNYEHFKSWLQNQYNEEDENKWFDEFWRNLDNEWLNFFWQKIDGDFGRLDDFYFNFLKNMALMHSIASHPEIPLENFKNLIELVRNDKSYDTNKIAYISFDKFYVTWTEEKIDDEVISKEEKTLFIFNKEILQFIEKSLITLIDIDNGQMNYSFLDTVLCKPFFDKSTSSLFVDTTEFTPSQPDTVLYYAFISLLNKYSDRPKEELKEWLRINRNLIYNTYIQGYEDLYKALQQIEYLLGHFEDFNQNILNNKIENSFFDNGQFKEEVLKIKLITADNSWFDPIVESENQYYFQGQIKFLIDFSELVDDGYDLNLFSKYSTTALVLFNNNIRRSEKKILQRALLCQGDYLPEYKSNYLFCIGNVGGLRTRNENWRLFFKSKNIDLLKDLIDDLGGIEITEKSLTNYIDNHLKITEYKKWESEFLFLYYPDAISYCKLGFIKWYSEDDIRLLPQKVVGGYHTELRSYCFYIEHKMSDDQIKSSFSPFEKFGYFTQQNSDAHPGCKLNGFLFNEKQYRLDIRYSKEHPKFEFCFYHEVGFEDRNIDHLIIEVLENQTFGFNGTHNHYYREVEYSKTFKEIENLCIALKNQL